MSYVDKLEVGKFVDRILECMLSLLDLLPVPSEEEDVNNEKSETHRKGTSTVVTILDNLLDEKLGNSFFLDMFKEFVDTKCKAVSTHLHIFRLLHYYIDNINPKNMKTLTSFFKSFQKMLLLMKASSSNNNDQEQEFRKRLNEILDKFIFFNQKPDTAYFGAQVALLKVKNFYLFSFLFLLFLFLLFINFLYFIF